MLYIRPEDHLNQKREVHPAHRQLHIEPVSEPLHVACAISNPERYYARYKHYQAFEKHMIESGVFLYTVELALSDRHFEVTNPNHPRHFQLRSTAEMFHKENLLRYGISKFDPSWHYGAYLDADFIMTRVDWATETIHQLQHYDWVQLFATYSDMMPDYSIGPSMPSFMNVYKNKLPTPRKELGYNYGGLWGAPGGGWAFRRESYDAVGGFLDCCILGSADWHMAVSLTSQKNPHKDLRVGTPGYLKALNDWDHLAQVSKPQIGYLQNHAIHNWHGTKSRRGYGTRTNILSKFQFDPYRDIKRDWQGIYSWTGNKPGLEEAVRQYFKARDEDSK